MGRFRFPAYTFVDDVLAVLVGTMYSSLSKSMHRVVCWNSLGIRVLKIMHPFSR